MNRHGLEVIIGEIKRHQAAGDNFEVTLYERMVPKLLRYLLR